MTAIDMTKSRFSGSTDFYAIQKERTHYNIVEIKLPEYRRYMRTEKYSIENLPCADRIKAAEHVVVVGCSSTGKLNIYRRVDKQTSKMKLVATLEETITPQISAT